MTALTRMRIDIARGVTDKAGRYRMAKSIRSKRKQKVIAVRREKYREREKKKLWEKHLAIQAQRTVDMAEVEGGEIK